MYMQLCAAWFSYDFPMIAIGCCRQDPVPALVAHMHHCMPIYMDLPYICHVTHPKNWMVSKVLHPDRVERHLRCPPSAPPCQNTAQIHSHTDHPHSHTAQGSETHRPGKSIRNHVLWANPRAGFRCSHAPLSNVGPSHFCSGTSLPEVGTVLTSLFSLVLIPQFDRWPVAYCIIPACFLFTCI